MRTLVLALVMGMMAGGTAWAGEFAMSGKADLNGDGVVEAISVADRKDHAWFTLRIGAAVTTGKIGDPVDGFKVVDIDTSDRLKEVAVHTPGPSDDDVYMIYWYDGRAIRPVGTVSRWPSFAGNGSVYVGGWMGFWASTDRYVLDGKSHTLRLIPQEFCYVGLTSKVTSAITLYETREMKKPIERLAPGSEAEVLLWSKGPSWEKDRYLVKAATDVVGWVECMALVGGMSGLPMAD